MTNEKGFDMGNYKFYTPLALAQCLMQLLPKREYKNVIDICCGSWNLLEAARKQFGSACYVGVDIDAKAEANCFHGAYFSCGDGRAFALKAKKKYDLVLSNPPFGFLKDGERVFKPGTTGKEFIKALISKRYENEMMQANLLLVEKGGVLLFILPTTFFEGETYQNIRKELCQKYTVDSIIKLPPETFGNSRINTCALIIVNEGCQTRNVKQKEAVYETGRWSIKNIGEISFKRMREGTWVRENGKPNILEKIIVFRGNISSAQLGAEGRRVFHSSGNIKDDTWEPSIRYCSDEDSIKKAKVVFPGDIIINRIGRYAKYWCVSQTQGFVSDCLIVIRVEKQSDVYQKLLRNSTNGRLNIATKGVAANYITINDILELL